MVRSTDRPAMTIAVDLGRKATKQKKQQNNEHFNGPKFRGFFRIVFTHFTIYWFKNIKINVFGENKFLVHFFQIEVQVFALYTGPGDLKKTPNI